MTICFRQGNRNWEVTEDSRLVDPDSLLPLNSKSQVRKRCAEVLADGAFQGDAYRNAHTSLLKRLRAKFSTHLKRKDLEAKEWEWIKEKARHDSKALQDMKRIKLSK